MEQKEMKSKTKQRHETAIHESGHAVIAVIFEVPFKYVTIEEDREEGSLGHILHTRSPKWFNPESGVWRCWNLPEIRRQRQLAERHIMVTQAGKVAHRRFLNSGRPWGHESDDRQAWAMANCFYPPDAVSTFLKLCRLICEE
jgi:hypothetical protein